MRILVVHHGLLPAPGRPVTGGALRAWHHGRALQEAGHEVHWITRGQDDQGSGFHHPADLARKVAALAPDAAVCVQLDDAPAVRIALGPDRPLAVDLYAPRLLEAPFEGALAPAAAAALAAIGAGDVFLVSNPRQRLVWLGVLALAGVDVRSDPTLHVPLVAPTAPKTRRARGLRLVAGGARWPWQDPIPALNRVLAHLDRRGKGKVLWFGGAPLIGHDGASWTLPEHPRLETPGWLAHDALLSAYGAATAAIDWLGHSPERSAALSFRHVDYLAAGLPVFTGPDTALTDVLGDAGWVVDPARPGAIESALDALVDDLAQGGPDRKSRSKAARALARGRFSLAQAEAPLVSWFDAPTVRAPTPSPLGDAAADHRARVQAQATAAQDRAARERAEAEAVSKRSEVAALTAQLQVLLGTVDRLGRAVDEVAGFKREAVAVLGGQSEQARRTLAEVERELAIARADLEKKSAELVAADQLRARLEHDLEGLRAELDQARNRGLFRR